MHIPVPPRRRTLVMSGLVALALLLTSGYSAVRATTNADTFVFTQFDAPVSMPGFRYTEIYGLNNAGDMVGIFNEPFYEEPRSEGLKGFAIRNGVFTVVDPPGAVYSEARGISRTGDIVGRFSYELGQDRGFLLRNGVYTLVEFPGAVYTSVDGISEDGDIAGAYSLGDGVGHGFVLRNGVYTTLDAPNAIHTHAMSLDRSRSVVGFYSHWLNQYWTASGFVFVDGIYTEIRHPYSNLEGARPRYNWAADINESNAVVGCFEDASLFRHRGFLFKNGAYTEIDVPGAIYTCAFGINDRGIVVGSFVDDSNQSHGFIAKRQ